MTERAHRVIDLAGLVLREDGPLRRDHVRPPDRRSAHYLERFDDRTLFYDAVRLEDGRSLITAPRLLNLWPALRDGLRVDGTRPRVRRRTWLRTEQLTLPAGPVTLDLGDGPRPLPVRPAQSDLMVGRNVLVAVNKNNALHWIEDWARYGAAVHGADAVVLFDNASTDYDAADIAERLARIEDLQATIIYRAPYPYGPTDRSGRFEVSPRFFQTGMLNIARRDALWHARAALSVDIDEIVRSETGARVFDLAARHPLGMVTIDGTWIYPDPAGQGAADHGAHVFRRVPDRKCNRKWCMTPQGPMARFGWAVHQVGGILQNLFTRTNAVRLMHCRGTSTGWKAKRFDMPEKITRDPDLEVFMARHFPRLAGDVSPRRPEPETARAATTKRS